MEQMRWVYVSDHLISCDIYYAAILKQWNIWIHEGKMPLIALLSKMEVLDY